MVEWPRGEATACKAVYTGSNPVSTSLHRRPDPTGTDRGRLAQWESTSLTRKGSLVQSQYRPPRSAHSEGRNPTGSGLRCAIYRDIVSTVTVTASTSASFWPGSIWTP